MYRAVSVSLGASDRDHLSEVALLDTDVQLQRIGTDGNLGAAKQLFSRLDGQVDALGVGGADLGVRVADRWYPLHAVQPLVADVHQTPVVDGGGLKSTLEANLASVVDSEIGLAPERRRVLITSAVDRWGMAESFHNAGYQCLFGDMMFALGLPLPLRSLQSVRRLATMLLPVFGRLPISWLYPTGAAQKERQPRWQSAFDWANVIAGDFHYIQRHMPADMPGKIIVTNTTTATDVTELKQAGVDTLITSTPVIDGRTYGTNLLEAGLVAASAKGRPLNQDELRSALARLGLRPTVRQLQRT